MKELIKWLQPKVARAIIDRSGLSGEYAIRFDLPPAASLQATSAAADTLPVVSSELSTAVREQLGLSLVPGKDEGSVLVVKRAEKLTPD